MGRFFQLEISIESSEKDNTGHWRLVGVETVVSGIMVGGDAAKSRKSSIMSIIDTINSF